jgi:hypothetical protein
MSNPNSANVQSVEAIRNVRVALILFLEQTTNAMGEMRQKIDRTMAWLDLDRPNYWKEQEQRAYDSVNTARVALEACRTRTVAGHRSDCIEEKKAMERAKRRVEYVHEKQALLRKWLVLANKESNEFRARTSSFARMLEHDVPLMIAQLGRMIEAIERYSEPNATLESTAIEVPPPLTLEPEASAEESTDNQNTDEPEALKDDEK